MKNLMARVMCVFLPCQNEYFCSFLFIADRRKVGNEKDWKGLTLLKIKVTR
jgi:hypothetical protein